jgi:protein phosphatase 2C family protein 2/3
VKAAVVSEQGKRPHMEDAYYLDLDFGGKGWVYGGVYDGHGGHHAAAYAADRLHERFLKKITAAVDPTTAYAQSYHEISEDLRDQDSGTTAVDFFINARDLFVANAGDSRTVIVTATAVNQLTVDHRLDN